MFMRDTRPKYNTKPPKRRFSVGDSFVDVRDGGRYDVLGAYRLREDVHEWIWVLGSLTPLANQSDGMRLIDNYVAATAEVIVRVVFEPFRSHSDAASYFMRIPPRPGLRGDTCHIANKDLLNQSKWRSE